MKAKITIKGKVHGVGYRVRLINMALEYGIDRFGVFNVEIDGKQAVMVLVDAPNEIVEIVKQRIEKEKPEKAVVESVSFEEYDTKSLQSRGAYKRSRWSTGERRFQFCWKLETALGKKVIRLGKQ